MLDKVIKIQGIGVLRNATNQGVDIARVTLIYAENTRGKSTLSSILRSCCTGDASILSARASVPSSFAPTVLLRFRIAGAQKVVKFENGGWTETVPDIFVFDQAFVEQNVYAGSEVNPEHHQSLLEFALGASAVEVKRKVDELALLQTAATKRKSAEEEQLKVFAGSTSLTQLEALPFDDAIDAKIQAVKQEISNATNASQIAKRPSLEPFEPPPFYTERFKATLEKQLDDVHDEAERLVQNHLIRQHPGAERWISQGQGFATGDECPYCGQQTRDVPLIQAYKTHFNAAYQALTVEVARLQGDVTASLEQIVPRVTVTMQLNAERCAAWSSQLEVAQPKLDVDVVAEAVNRAQSSLLALAKQKADAPMKRVADSDTFAQAQSDLGLVQKELGKYSAQVAAVNHSIASLKAKLSSASLDGLQQNLRRLELQRVRHSVEVVKLFAARASADEERKKAEAEKTAAKEEFNKLMVDTLQAYESSINTWLMKFGATFAIEKLKPNYAGTGTARTEYGIRLHTLTVPAGKRTTGEPSFETMLSDSDKRTLALAFFLARVFGDKKLHQRTVVLDDPFVSMDRHRRSQTVQAVVSLAAKAAQVIVMAHDEFFLKDVDRACDRKVVEPKALQFARGADGSELQQCDLTGLCASSYYRRYAIVSNYVKNGKGELLTIAKCGRPLLEGHLHRRFPMHVPDAVTLGSVIAQIRDATPDSPLSVLKLYVEQLVWLNDYFSPYHHDTNGKVARDDVTDGELQPQAAMLMKFLHEGRF